MIFGGGGFDFFCFFWGCVFFCVVFYFEVGGW